MPKGQQICLKPYKSKKKFVVEFRPDVIKCENKMLTVAFCLLLQFKKFTAIYPCFYIFMS